MVTRPSPANGVHGDTQLVHVNKPEVTLLQAISGNRTRNSKDGRRQFYDTGESPGSGNGPDSAADTSAGDNGASSDAGNGYGGTSDAVPDSVADGSTLDAALGSRDFLDRARDFFGLGSWRDAARTGLGLAASAAGVPFGLGGVLAGALTGQPFADSAWGKGFNAVGGFLDRNLDGHSYTGADSHGTGSGGEAGMQDPVVQAILAGQQQPQSMVAMDSAGNTPNTDPLARPDTGVSGHDMVNRGAPTQGAQDFGWRSYDPSSTPTAAPGASLADAMQQTATPQTASSLLHVPTFGGSKQATGQSTGQANAPRLSSDELSRAMMTSRQRASGNIGSAMASGNLTDVGRRAAAANMDQQTRRNAEELSQFPGGTDPGSLPSEDYQPDEWYNGATRMPGYLQAAYKAQGTQNTHNPITNAMIAQRTGGF